MNVAAKRSVFCQHPKMSVYFFLFLLVVILGLIGYVTWLALPTYPQSPAGDPIIQQDTA